MRSESRQRPACLSSVVFSTRLPRQLMGLRERCLYLAELSGVFQILQMAPSLRSLNRPSVVMLQNGDSFLRCPILKNNFLFIGNNVSCNLSTTFVRLFFFFFFPFLNSPQIENSLLLMRERGSERESLATNYEGSYSDYSDACSAPPPPSHLPQAVKGLFCPQRVMSAWPIENSRRAL